MSVKETIANLEHPIIMGFGNPLLDIIIPQDENNLLSKYRLTLDSQTEIEEKDINQLIDTIPESKIILSAGGCVQNTMRIVQKLCGDRKGPRICVYYGGLGKDSRGETLKKLVDSANIDARYAIHPTLPSGVCVSIIKDMYRTLVANIGAASVFTLDDYKSKEVSLNSIKIIYIEGFFLTHSFDVAKEVVKKGLKKNIMIVFNLSGTYIFEKFQDAVCEMVGISKIVFGNVKEMTALANSLNLEFENVQDIPYLLNNLKSVTINASNSMSSDWLSNDCIFVMTQGGMGSAIVVWGQGHSAHVSPITPDLPIIDTTGAGDSLVAGFLAGVLSGKDPKTCLEWGCKVASNVITNLGATLSDDLPPDFLQ